MALYFGNRGFFPSESIAAAREEMKRVVEDAGFNTIMAPVELTKYGAVCNAKEGKIYADFLKKHEGEYDGVIICLPNFGDENGVIAAFRDCKVPVLVQAYSDDMDYLGPQYRRDAFCGKLSILNALYQIRVPFTTFQSHTLNPDTLEFSEQITKFGRICGIVKGMKTFKVGGIGARTTDFKTVRYDEVTLENHDIDTETLDLSSVIPRVKSLEDDNELVQEKLLYYKKMTDFSQVPEEKSITIAKIGVILDEIIEEYDLDAIALRCWSEFQIELGVSPCVPVCDLNSKGIAASCEMDVSNAVAMRALTLASEEPVTVLDWNNNYDNNDNKCIMFHCGPTPNELLLDKKGQVGRHRILENTYGVDNCIGVNAGRFDNFDFTYASAKTEKGEISFYVGHGKFTDDPIPEDFFGTHGVAEVKNLQDVLQYVGYEGYTHHVSLTRGLCKDELKEALEKYLGYNVKVF